MAEQAEILTLVTRECTKCNQVKNLTDFPTIKDKGKIYRLWKCKLCRNKQMYRNRDLTPMGKEAIRKREITQSRKIRGVKLCRKCNQEKLLSQFFKLGKAHHPNCKKCAQAYQSAFYRKSEEYRKSRIAYASKENRKRKYGVTTEMFDALLVAQNKKCAICDVELNGSRFSLKGQLDHCHATKKVRGILCGQCNTSLGNFKENISILLRAIQYLEKFKE